MCIGPRNPANSHSASLYKDLSQERTPFLLHFLCTWRSANLKPQSDTWSTASSMNGFVVPWRIDSSTSLCQNSSNFGSSIKISSCTHQDFVTQTIKKNIKPCFTIGTIAYEGRHLRLSNIEILFWVVSKIFNWNRTKSFIL